MCRCIGSAVSAAGECGFSRYFKRCISFPCNKVVVFQRRCRRYGLRIEQRSIVIQAYIEHTCVIGVFSNNDIQLVTGSARVFGRTECVSSLCAAAVKTVRIQRLCIHEQFAQRQHFIIVVVVAEQLQAVFLKISACNSKNLTINAPVQHQRHSHIAPVGQCSRRFRGAGEIDVCTRQYLILNSPQTATKCHINLPCLSYSF